MLRTIAILTIGGASISAKDVNPRVIVVTLHGADPGYIEQLAERSSPSSIFKRIKRSGIGTRHVVPVDPALTSTARVSMLTGTMPRQHGIVGNSFHRITEPFQTQASGFGTRFGTEAIWEAASRQNRQVIRIGSLFLRGSAEAPSGDLTFASGEQISQSLVVSLKPDANISWQLGNQRVEHVLPLTGANKPEALELRMPGDAPSVRFHALAMDTIADGQRAYDRIILDTDRDLRNGPAATLNAGGWASFQLRRESPQVGAWTKLLQLDKAKGTAQLYVGAVHVNRGYPAEFVRDIEATTGVYPGAPDYASLNAGAIDERTWIEQAERENQFFRDAAIAAVKARRFDLMLFEQPGIDNVVHQFLLTDPRQAGYHDEQGKRRARYATHIERIYQSVGANVTSILSLAGPADAVISSDYSLQPAHTRYDVNAILARAGFKVGTDAGAEVRGLASSTSAHIYINRNGRSVDQIDVDLRRMTDTFRNFRDVESGELVFDDVLTRQDLERRGLLSPETSGDLWVRARSGYALSSRLKQLDMLKDAPFLRGEHGYRSGGSAGGGMLAVLRNGRQGAEVPPVCAVDVAAIIAALLGINPPSGYDQTRSKPQLLHTLERTGSGKSAARKPAGASQCS